MRPAATQPFDYEAKRWGLVTLRPRPWFANGLKLRYLLEDLEPHQGKVLDVGCGAGSVAKAVKRERPDLQVIGCDPSRSALSAAEAEPEGVEFRVGQAEKLPFADCEFDFVWMFDVLEHVENPERVLREVARVLRPGGVFHIVLPLEGQPWTLYRFLGCGTRWTAKVRHGGHIQVFSSERFTALAAFCGLTATKTRWSYHGLLQAVDVLYFSWLDWHGPVTGSVEDMAAAKPGFAGSIMRAASKSVATVAWGEARLLASLPGGCGHFACRRNGGETRR